MLGNLFIGHTVEVIADLLAERARGGAIAVVGQPRLGRALAERGLAITHMSAKPKSLRRLTGDRGYCREDALPLADACLDAVVGVGAGHADDWQALLGEWSRAVIDRGSIVLVDRAPATEMSRRVLCSGLADLTQHHLGRTVITSGVVAKL